MSNRKSKLVYDHSGGCVGTEEYYMSTRAAVLVQKIII